MTPTPEAPLVTIAIPAYNRAATLARAIDSAQAQTHLNVEIFVCDNASTDETAQVVADLAAADPRVQLIRRDHNAGPTANFNTALRAGTGEYHMLLGDDDWIDPGYVEECLRALIRDPGLALACGRARYFDEDGDRGLGNALQLPQASASERVHSYYAQVTDNGCFYGLTRRAIVERLPPQRDGLANDWFHVAGVAFQGRLITLPSTVVHRAIGGTSANLAGIARAHGTPAWHARLPHLVIAWTAAREIVSSSPVYASLPLRRRVRLAASCARVIVTRHATILIGHALPAPVRPGAQRILDGLRRRV